MDEWFSVYRVGDLFRTKRKVFLVPVGSQDFDVEDQVKLLSGEIIMLLKDPWSEEQVTVLEVLHGERQLLLPIGICNMHLEHWIEKVST